MSNCVIVINGHNADHNSVMDLVAAIGEIGAVAVTCDEQNYLIEATVPSHELPTLAAMDGISYVRTVFSYFCEGAHPRKAA